MTKYVLALALALAPHLAAAQCCCTCSPTPMPTPTSTWTSTFTLGPASTPTALPSTWAMHAGSATSDVGTVVRVAPNGDIFVAGFFTGIADFGPPAGAFSSTGMDVFVAKYSPTGLPLWVVHWGNAASNSARGLAIDHQGNVIVTGQFQRTMNLGCGVLTSAIQDSYDIFVAKLSPAGTCLWSQRFGSGGDDSGAAVAVDGGDNVILTGYFTGRVSFGGTALFSSNGTGSPSTFVAKYNPVGVHLWSKGFSPTQSNNGPDQAFGLAVATNGDILVAGEFQGTEYFDGVGPVTSAGNSPDAYLAYFATNGTYRWTRTIGSTGADRAYAVIVNRDGNAVVTGYFAGSVDFGGKTLVATGPLNAFVAAYTVETIPGSLIWARAITGPGQNIGMDVTVDAAGEAIATGSFQFTSAFDGGSLLSAGQSDIYIATYNASGVLARARGIGSALADVGYSVAPAPDGAVIATGYFRATMLVGTTQLISTGQTDIYLIKVTP